MLPPLNASFVDSILDYCPDTGVFCWKHSTTAHKHSGKLAGSIRKYGYVLIGINGKRYPAHKLAWLACKGIWPEGAIDHINRDKTDNRISNLRLATHSENVRNRVRRDNSSGVPGVSLHKATGKWHAYIGIVSSVKSLGYFDSKDEAVRKRKAAEVEYGVSHACVRIEWEE